MVNIYLFSSLWGIDGNLLMTKILRSVVFHEYPKNAKDMYAACCGEKELDCHRAWTV